MPSLEVFGIGLVQQRALRMAGVVEFGFSPRWPTGVRKRVRWAGDGGHGAVLARAPFGAKYASFELM